jgi:hypothetical protein
MSLSRRFLTVSALLVLAAWAPLAGQEKKKLLPKPVPFPAGISWQLGALSQEPLKIVTTRHLPKEGAVFWVFELTRDLTVYEDQAYWGPAFKLGKRPRFRFELLDEDGIILRTAEAHYIGEYVNKAGKRFGAYFAIPPELAGDVKTVIAIQP